MAAPKQRVVYAPFTHMLLREIDSNVFIPTGQLIKGSEIQVEGIYVGPEHDRRYVRSRIAIKAIDVDCDFENDNPFLSIMNKQVYVVCNCYHSGGFVDGPFRYTVKQEHIPDMGMRYVHELRGYSVWLGWVTFLSSGWDTFKAKFLS